MSEPANIPVVHHATPRATSLEAYYALRDSGALSSLRWAVYDALFHHGPMTRNELDAHLRGANAINASYSRRLTELERMGLARRGDPRPCRFSSRNCEPWDVTSATVPMMVERGRSKLQVAEDQAAQLAGLCRETADWIETWVPGVIAKNVAIRFRARIAEIVRSG